MTRIAFTSDRSRSTEGSIAVVAVAVLAVLAPGVWGYTLIDPWETHYAEVGRSILERGDWVRLWWQGESFRSKPALLPWLIAASLALHGIAADGGHSGELIGAGGEVMWAVRLPSVVFATAGLVLLWVLLARRVSRRVAWLAVAILVTMPMVLMVARQAITDAPMLGAMLAAIACFGLSITADPGARGARESRRPDGGRVALLALCAVVVPQLVYNGQLLYLTRGAREAAIATAPFAAGLLVVLATAGWRWRARTPAQVAALWGYAFTGVCLLAKGPPGVAVAAVFVLALLATTGNWRWLVGPGRVVEGLAIIVLVAGPWHAAMACADGRVWADVYFGIHWFARAASGIHGERGGFAYFARQIGIGTWPWIALVPASLVAAWRARSAPGPRGALRAAACVWAVAGFGFFSVVETKFHHYVLPVVPALAILVAIWIDEAHRRSDRAALAAGAALALVIGASVAAEHAQLIELAIYRYDRPWPEGVELGPEIAAAVALASGAAALALSRRARGVALAALGAVALAAALWTVHRYTPAAAPHWGQRALHDTYYRERRIHGVEIAYPGFAELARAIDRGVVRVELLVPDTLELGDAIRIVRRVGSARYPAEGRVVIRGETEVWIAAPPPARAKAIRSRARRELPGAGRARTVLDADRLIAWQLYWRGENFWTGGEIWGERAEARTVFRHVGSGGLEAYLGEHGIRGRRYFVATEASRQGRLAGHLPTERARDTLRVENASSNKFVLMSFVL